MACRDEIALGAATRQPVAHFGRLRQITSHIKGYPFEVALPPGLPASGVILSDHVKNLDWRSRRAEFLCRVPKAVLGDVIGRISALILEP